MTVTDVVPHVPYNTANYKFVTGREAMGISKHRLSKIKVNMIHFSPWLKVGQTMLLNVAE